MDERGRVVVGVDDSPGSRDALAYALRDAVRRGASVEVIAAFAPPDYPSIEVRRRFRSSRYARRSGATPRASSRRWRTSFRPTSLRHG